MTNPEQELEYDKDNILINTAFRDQVHNPRSVLYPSCGFDASPSRVFDNVTFVDVEKGNEGCIKALQEKGFRAIRQDIREYQPAEEHDLLILLNPQILTEWATQHLKRGGYVLSNNYHGNAAWMYEHPEQFTLWGTIDFVKQDENERAVVSRDLTDLFVPVKDEEELRRFRPEYYEFLKRAFEFMSNNSTFDSDGAFEEVWERYMELTHEGRPGRRKAERYIFVKK